MPKYNIEGGFDFYTELYKSLDINESLDSQNECLITNVPLTENYVTLECGHKFNYKPLFNDIMNHKKKFNSMETHILKGMEIRCPYCRNIQKKMLPYYECYEECGITKVHGVNYFDESKLNIAPTQFKWMEGVCSHMDVVANSDPPIMNCCKNTYVTQVDLIGKTFCSYHKYGAIQQHMKEKKLAEKQKLLEAKLQQKEQLKQEKVKQKELLKQEKLKEKQEKLKAKIPTPALSMPNTDENVVLSSSSLCVQILHNGKNKGQPCNHKVVDNQLCSRHNKMYIAHSSKCHQSLINALENIQLSTTVK